MSHVFDPGAAGEPYTATVRLTGRRVGISGLPTSRDSFIQDDIVEEIVPGSGPLSITSWVYGLEPGEWSVNAELLRPDLGSGAGKHISGEPIRRAVWSWRRWALSGSAGNTFKTRWAMTAPLARMPAVLPGSWALLGVLAAVVALATQALILNEEHAAVGPALVVSLVALLAGMLGAKVWYAVLHPGPWRQAILGGWAVDGFLVVAPLVAIGSLLVLALPTGPFLDGATPGLFFGVAIGRVGCLFTGCCAGRCSRSRWALWSSDRRIGARRIPSQLLESVTGLTIGAVATAAVLGHLPRPDGAVFIGALAVYLVVRQALLRVRAESRQFSWRRRAMTTKLA